MTSSVPSSALALALPLVLAAVWFVLTPVLVHSLNPRLRERNPTHFSKLVSFSRAWGVAAVVAGVIVGKAI